MPLDLRATMRKYGGIELSEDQRKAFEDEYRKRSKKSWVAYLLWFILGFCGAHKFYLDQQGMGLLYMFTLGIFAIGWMVDAFTMPKRIHQLNENVLNDLILEMFEKKR